MVGCIGMGWDPGRKAGASGFITGLPSVVCEVIGVINDDDTAVREVAEEVMVENRGDGEAGENVVVVAS